MWELGHKEGWAPKYWWFWTGEVEPFFELLKLDKTLKSSLDTKEIKPLNPQGNQPWIFIGRTGAEAECPILWPSDEKSLFTGKDADAGKDWRQEEKGTPEDEMVRWHHQFDEREFEQAQEMVMDRETWHATVHGFTKSWTQPINKVDWATRHCIAYISWDACLGPKTKQVAHSNRIKEYVQRCKMLGNRKY